METRNIFAEIFMSFPGHLWVIPVAAAITFFGLKLAEDSYLHGDKLRWITYALLIALVVIPNGYLLMMPPEPEMPLALVSREPLPNYEGLLYLDAFFVFVGWVLGGFARSKS